VWVDRDAAGGRHGALRARSCRRADARRYGAWVAARASAHGRTTLGLQARRRGNAPAAERHACWHTRGLLTARPCC
jgi:hypothetical protein